MEAITEIVTDSSNDNFEVTIPIPDTDNIKINIDNEANVKKVISYHLENILIVKVNYQRILLKKQLL